jgi:AraC family transcriptional regulator
MPSSQIHLINYTTGEVFSAAPEGTVLHSSANLGWRGITVESHCIPSLEQPEHYIEGHRLMVHVGKPTLFEWKEGDRWRQTILKQGDFCLQSHGETNAPRWQNDLEFLAIALDPSFVNDIFRDTKAPEKISFQPQRGQVDPVITQFATRFKAELESGSYGGALYSESMGLAFALHLLEQHGVQRSCADGDRTLKLPRPRGKLSALQLRQSVEYVHDRLTHEISLVELAAQTNLSIYHFARLFKHSVGLSPHQYVLQNRVERAKKLICISKTPSLTEIGLGVGFYDQSHFTKAFKQIVGVSPKAFAKQIAN